MASEVQIAKLALAHVADRFDINSLDESSVQAEQVSLVFEDVRDLLLREHPWKFAKRWTSPSALSGTPPASWTYMYAYPSDALRVWKIENPLGRKQKPLEFDIGYITGDIKVILTDQSDPEFMYTYRETNTSRFDAGFVVAFSWRLAQHICLAITGDEALADSIARKAEYAVSMAKALDSNEGVEPEHNRDPDWLDAR